MPTESEIAEKFWKAVKSDRTMMIGLAGVEEGLSQPMTAQLDDGREEGPIYFFTSRDTDLAQDMGGRHRATAHFAKTLIPSPVLTSSSSASVAGTYEISRGMTPAGARTTRMRVVSNGSSVKRSRCSSAKCWAVA